MGIIIFIFMIALFVVVTIGAIALRIAGTLFRIILPAPRVLVRDAIQPLPAMGHSSSSSLRCRRSTCRAVNPGHARFCRQCGLAMTAAMDDHRLSKQGVRPIGPSELTGRVASRLAGQTTMG